MSRNKINEINVLSAKNNIYDIILERPTEGLAKPLCFYGTACKRKNPAHIRDFLHMDITDGNIRDMLAEEKSRFLNNFNEFIKRITILVEKTYSEEDVDDMEINIVELNEFIARFMPYIKHLFFLDENVIRDLAFDINKLDKFIKEPLMQLQTGDAIPIQEWFQDYGYVPLTKIMDIKIAQLQQQQLQLQQRNIARDEAELSGSAYDGQRQGKKRGRVGGKRTRHKIKRMKGGKKKTMKVSSEKLGWRPRVRENNINKLLLKSRKNGKTKLIIDNYPDKDDVYIVNSEIKKRTLFNKKKRTVKKALRR